MSELADTKSKKRARREAWRAAQFALDLAAQNIPVFPCAASKRPATPNGFKDASAGPDDIRRLWRNHPGELIGVPTGAVSGFDVLDLDVKHQEARDWWRDNRRRLPRTRIHRTQSGGLHLLFTHTDVVRCSASKIARGVDTRADGGYIIWWPAGGEPVLSMALPAPWPDWLLEAFRPEPAPKIRSVVRVPDNRLIIKLVQMAAGAREGERNSLTFWCACRAGEMVATGELGATEAIAIIAEAATRSGLPRAEAMRTAKSGVMRGCNV